MRALVVCHHAEDEPGFVGDALRARGFEVAVHRFPEQGPLPDLGVPRRADSADRAAGAEIDYVVVLGSAWSVNDDAALDGALEDELAFLRRAMGAGVGVLGVCFGAQALNVAAGGAVEKAPRTEIGWTTIDTTDACLVAPGPWLQFHGDRCLVPSAARVIATNEIGVQAFAVGTSLGVQFHPEVDGAQLQRWLDHGGDAEVEAAGGDPAELLERTRAEEPAARRRAADLVDAALGIAGRATADR